MDQSESQGLLFQKSKFAMNRSLIPFYLNARLCGLFLLSMFFLECIACDGRDDNVAMVVGARQITAEELKRDMEFMSAGIDTPSKHLPVIREGMVREIIDHYLILEYGRENGISVPEAEIQEAMQEIKGGYTEEAFRKALLRGYVNSKQWEARLRERFLVRRIIKKVTDNIAPPSYQEIKRYFEKNREGFSSPKMIFFRQIVTRTKKEAEDLHARIRQGEKMSELAAMHSIAPEADDGGKVGWVGMGTLEESMENVLFSLPKGKVSPVTETPYGYHIFEVLSVRPAGVKELPEVIKEIENGLFSQKREAFFKKWIRGLRAHIRVRLNEKLINRLELS